LAILTRIAVPVRGQEGDGRDDARGAGSGRESRRQRCGQEEVLVVRGEMREGGRELGAAIEDDAMQMEEEEEEEDRDHRGDLDVVHVRQLDVMADLCEEGDEEGEEGECECQKKQRESHVQLSQEWETAR